ncbi:mucin-2-like [Notolabrus celidotus]|uniref:mucin-2-like n=1 Tax=Notolabrus celidotus TaxID=1203425 RepID=UPI0014903BEF|nr:mucin-2-like [Notolabrus celidotus]
MSFQFFHRGLSDRTTSQDLRVNQGRNGCTPQGLHIPQGTAFILGAYSPQLAFLRTPMDIRVDSPFMDLFPPPAMSEPPLQNPRITELDDTYQRAIRPRNNNQENGFPNMVTPVTPLVTPPSPTDPAAREAELQQMIQPFGGYVQLESNSDGDTGALAIASAAQPPWMFSETPFIGNQTSPVIPEVNTEASNQTMFQTPSQVFESDTRGRQALDFVDGAHQNGFPNHFIPMNPPTFPPMNPPTVPPMNPPTVPPMNPPTVPPMNPPTVPPMDPAAREDGVQQIIQTFSGNLQLGSNSDRDTEALDISSAAQPLQTSPLFGNQTNPVTPEVKVEETNQTLFQTPTQVFRTDTRVRRELDFSAGAQQPLQTSARPIIANQTNPATPEVKVKERNQTLFQTQPQAFGTDTRVRQKLDFSAGAQQPLQAAATTIFGNQNPATPEVKVEETNQTLFQTPTMSFGTNTGACRGFTFSNGAQQPPSTFSTTPLSGNQASPATPEVKVKETKQTLFQTPTTSFGTNTRDGQGFDFSTGAQQPLQMSARPLFGNKTNPTTPEVKVEETNQTLFQTPTTSFGTNTRDGQGFDFSTGAQQPLQTSARSLFGNQTNPATPEVKVKETNQTLFQTQTQVFGTDTRVRQELDFSAGAQQPLQTSARSLFGNQTNPATPKVKVKETNQTLFQTQTQVFGTDTRVRQELDFSAGAQQPLQTSARPIIANQTNPATPKVKVKETNQTLFETPMTSFGTNTGAFGGFTFSTPTQQNGFSNNSQPTVPPVTPRTVPRTVPQTVPQTVQPTVPASREAEVQQMNRTFSGNLRLGSNSDRHTGATNQTLFRTPTQALGSDTRACQARDFSTGEKQLKKWNIPTNTAQEMTKKERDEHSQAKAKQDKIRADLQLRIQTTEQKMAEIKSSEKACKGSLDAEWVEINDVFSAVQRVVDEARLKALKPLEERRKRVKRETQDLVQKLQKEIDKLRKTIDELDQNQDPGVSHLLEPQSWERETLDTSFSFSTLRATTSKMIQEIQEKVEKLSSTELKRTPKFAVDVKLDPSSAHQCLDLSTDGKTVRDGGKNNTVPDCPQRFDMFGSVLGLNRLTSGKSYWEVEVRNKSGWDLGVARVDATRKGKLSVNTNNGFWAIVHFENKMYAALSVPPVCLGVREKPQKVGVFVDYEEGLVSFYDVTRKSHIYSFTECSFNGGILPYFSPHLKQNEINSAPLIISAVNQQE